MNNSRALAVGRSSEALSTGERTAHGFTLRLVGPGHRVNPELCRRAVAAFSEHGIAIST